MQAFDVYFLGETLPGADPAQVRRAVAKLFKVPDDAVERLFAGNALRIKQGVDVDAASRYRAAFRDAGALVQIVAAGAPPPQRRDAVPPPTRAPDVPADAEMPPRDGIVEDEDFGLAPPGAIIDETPPVPPAAIDTSRLSVQPANSGSLADCRIDKPARPIPDISHLKLVDD